MRPSPFLSLLFVLCSLLSNAQRDPKETLQVLYDTYPEEKIYIWFNKPEYVAGETAWFKAYVFSGHDLSNISTNLYVEFYSGDRKLLSSKLIPLVNGSGQGSIDLSDNLSEDVYYVRAYTRWMLNFDESHQYLKPLNIFNPTSSMQLVAKKANWQAEAFAEGGNLLHGITSRVSVRLTSQTTLPMNWTGYVFEKSDPAVHIADFQSMDRNIASFSFTPEFGRTYMANISDGSGRQQTIYLPVVKKEGVAFSVQNLDDSIVCRVYFKGINASGSYTLLGQIQHQLIYQASFQPREGVVKMSIPAKGLFNGILQLTVFDETNRAVAERLVFVNPKNLQIESAPILQMQLAKKSRSESILEIGVDSLNWSSYAISITEAEALVSTTNENIISSLWFTPDITKPVQDAGWYFSGKENSTEALDALLISEKWKWFNWNSVDKLPVLRFYPHNYLSFSGVARRNRNILAKRDITLILYAPDSSSQLMLVRTDSSGAIHLSDIVFEDTIKAFFLLNEKKGNPKNINIDFVRDNKAAPYHLPFPEHGYILVPRVSSNTVQPRVRSTMQSLENEKDLEQQYKTLAEVVVRSKMKTAKDLLNEKLTSGIFRANNEISFDFINEQQNAIAYTNILQWLQGRVAGLSVQYEQGVYVPYIRGNAASIFVDEMPFSADAIENISVSDIAFIKVIKGPMAFVTGAAGGVIAIYTIRGDLRPAQREPSLNSNLLIGYDAEKPFLQPNYSNTSIRQPEKDLRSQLLWSSLMFPDMSITSSRQRFVTNDNSKPLRVVIQGMTEKGFPVYFEKIIE